MNVHVGRLATLLSAVLFGLLLPGSVVVATWAAPAAPPPTFVVNSVSDAAAAGDLTDGVCSTVTPYTPPLTCTLRAAIMKANHFPGGGVTIDFDTQLNAHAILLTIHPVFNDDGEALGDLNISQTTHLVGNGAGLTIIDAQAAQDRAFWIEPGAVVDMSGLTIQNGFEGQFGGGGLYVASGGSLAMDHSAVLNNTDNSGLGGGGIMDLGVLTVTTSLVYANIGGGGGGIDVGGRATVAASTIISNEATTGDGGGLNNFGTLLTLVDSTVTSNTTNAFDGGGVAGVHGTTNIVNSTISGNRAHSSGGGVAALFLGTQVSLFNATVADNVADFNLTGSGLGGGLSAASSGGIQTQNSLIADNYASVQFPGPTYLSFRDDCYGPVTSAGYNLLTFLSTPDIHTCGLVPATGDQITTTDRLGPLQANGGPTLTQALLPGSPAIDAGNPGGCNGPAAVPLTTDQRGYPRTANGAGTTRCDIGAFELQRIVDLPLVRR